MNSTDLFPALFPAGSAAFLPLVVVFLLAIPFTIISKNGAFGKFIAFLFLLSIPFLLFGMHMIIHHCSFGSICAGVKIPSFSMPTK